MFFAFGKEGTMWNSTFLSLSGTTDRNGRAGFGKYSYPLPASASFPRDHL